MQEGRTPIHETPEGVVRRLVAARAALPREEDPVLAFDADGTLWSGDVGNDLFEALIAEEAVREEARAALIVEARAAGTNEGGSTTDIAQGLYRALTDGTYEEVRAFAMMAWVFAGFALPEAEAFARRVIAARGLDARLHRFLSPVLAWAETEKVPVWVVSASPRWIVEIGVALLGIPAHRVVAMTPRMQDGRIAAELAGRPVYGNDKPIALREACPGATLLGAFGDSSYDVPMLAASRVPVGVRPKAGLLARAAEVPSLVVVGT
ncbi:HAD family hydrolase [Polyangium jinanense]|uniref:Haloacid dehalogenase-like hydrolase n=1 Tax=Polyangium jinanense TaxID=2829994 RepID=A0A9X3WWL3_9BACT|nr:HAD family hydrolase [Polyangium jinanense]MDC3953266.1 haloacid dehalogenase-like hydrolase [Polyangium jinanense]MDC3979614.1 haloacid dehalogenase-like hydrolase [Polyangium jinanense]